MRRSLVTLLALMLALAGCVQPDPPEDENPPEDGDGNGGNGTTPEPEADLAFNASRAYDLAVEQVIRENGSVRYRVPGTDGNREAAHLIADHFADAGLDVAWDHFNATYGCEETWMHNVVGTIPGNPERVFYVGAHYDSRPIADKDPDPARRDEPIQGANDGGSGVGVVLELARVLAPHAWNATLKFVLFDGEDGGRYGGRNEDGRSCTEWILGSKAFVADLTDEDVARAEGMILVDMAGDADARFPREGYSVSPQNRPLGDAVWATAGGLGYARFTNDSAPAITDDHVPFSNAGIPAVDIIDLREGGAHLFPPTHHTHADDVDHLSEEPMGAVGRTLERFLIDRYAT